MQTPDRFSLLPPHPVAGVVLLTRAATTGTPLIPDSRISPGGLKRTGLRFVSRIFLALAFASSAHAATISGNVSNLGTGNLLEGAQVSVPALGLATLTDNTGRYVLPALPAGTHEVVVTYLGLDPSRATVAVSDSAPASRNFDLTTGIYKLDAFTVAGEREGGAAAITAQRNAANVKNVVAMDSYGNLPNMSASELAILLPGVSSALNLENGIDGFTVRGMGPTLNNITLDGAMLSTQGAMARQGRINNLTGAMFEGLELIKGHTPDKGADSLGGTINLKSRSPLSMREKRRVTYNFAVRWAPPFTEQIPLRETHRSHPLLNVGYAEVFDVAGGQRNLGVVVNTFYSENVGAAHSTTRDFENTPNRSAFLWDYQTFDQYNNRKQASVNVKAEYRLSPTTKLSLNTIANDANEMGKLRFTTRAFTNQVVFNPALPVTGTNATAGIMPGYTDRNPITPSLWNEDRYFAQQSLFTGTRRVTEDVTAGYVMAQGRVANTGFLTGVRVEETATNSWGWVRARVLSTVAQQTADPVGSAQRDYSTTRRVLRGSYTKSFPSIHLTQDISPNWKARLSWSTSFGRPPMTSLLPNETINETAQTLTVNNPSLLPQSAKNWDASLEYYFEPVGSLSVGFFHKTINDFIVSGINTGTIGTGTDNGYAGEYGGFTRLSSANAGTAFVQGWELSYQQQFTSLPGWLKGLGLTANLTALEAHGDYGGRGRRDTRDVEGFVPRIGNVSVFWRHRGITSRVIVNYTGESITEFTDGSPARSRFLAPRTVVNLSFGYQWRPAVSFSIDANNLTNAPQSAYRGYADRMQFKLFGGTTLTAGINGRF